MSTWNKQLTKPKEIKDAMIKMCYKDICIAYDKLQLSIHPMSVMDCISGKIEVRNKTNNEIRNLELDLYSKMDRLIKLLI